MAFQGNAFQNNAFQEGQGTPLPREPYRVDRIVPVQVVDNYTWIQNGFAVLLGAVVQNPFPNEDWPNPQWPQAIRQDQQSWYNLNLIGQDVLPNNQDQWPNPRLREPNRQDFQGWYTLSLIGKDVLPNGPGGQVQRDFPNPTLSIVRRPDWQQAFPLPLVGADFLPFRQTDWPDPTLGIVRRPDWQWSYNLNLIGQDVLAFRQPDWPNPRGPQRSIDLITDTWNLTATISPVGVLPLTAFAQYASSGLAVHFPIVVDWGRFTPQRRWRCQSIQLAESDLSHRPETGLAIRFPEAIGWGRFPAIQAVGLAGSDSGHCQASGLAMVVQP